MISVVYATTSQFPVILITFDGPVNVSTINASLENKITGVDYGLVMLPHSPENVTFSFKPSEPLDSGFYQFEISAYDMFGNKGDDQIYDFQVSLPGFDITMVLPTFGYSADKPFDIEVHTNRQSTGCKYSLIESKEFDNIVSEVFQTVDSEGMIHRISSYNGATGEFFVLCKDVFGNVHKKKFNLIYDTQNPLIIKLEVDNVAELREGTLRTKMKVNASEPVVCKYMVNNDAADYASMENFFDGNDEYDNNTYNAYHDHYLLGEASEGGDLIDGQENYVRVICKDFADRMSEKVEATFMVNSKQAPIITINSPKPNTYTKNKTVTFDISTNKQATCKYGPEGSITRVLDSANIPDENRYTDKATLQEGVYNYFVECAFTPEGTIPAVPLTFTIDNTKPGMVFINISDQGIENLSAVTYHTDKLLAKWLGEDNHSGVAEYEYWVILDGITTKEIIANGKTPSIEPEITGLSLEDGSRYRILVSAIDRVGLQSANITSDPITVDISKTPASCSNNVLDKDEVDVDCGGICGCCPARKNCSINADCCSKICNVNKTCEGFSCADGITNGDESDTDCGGTCPKKCGVGKFCKKDTDCISGYCEEDTDTGLKTCSSYDTCSNLKKDGLETDIDCGGISCSGCRDGKNCSINSDCLSLVCEDMICQTPTCSDNTKNQDESDVDCGGSCLELCKLNQKCKLDSDCETGLCENGICSESGDRDGDGMPNWWEEQYRPELDPDDSTDADEDPDGDGLINLIEYQKGTNPLKADSDGDGWTDGEEIKAGTDPLDPESKPRSVIWTILIWLLILALLGVGGYFGYRKYQEYMAEKDVKKARGHAAPIEPKPKKEGISAKKIPPSMTKVRPRPAIDIEEARDVLEIRKREREQKRKRLLEQFAPTITKKTKEEIEKEEKIKKTLGKYMDVSKITHHHIERLKGKSTTQIDSMLKGKKKDEISKLMQEFAEEEEKKPKKEKKKAKELKTKTSKKKQEEDVFAKLAKALPGKK